MDKMDKIFDVIIIVLGVWVICFAGYRICTDYLMADRIIYYFGGILWSAITIFRIIDLVVKIKLDKIDK